MDKRHSSPSSRAERLRPRTSRKRSHSLPISDALGCSTPEAELILAEGRAAVRSRQASRHRGRRMRDGIETFRPQDHIGYLIESPAVSESTDEDSPSPPIPQPSRHSRIPSDATDRSTSTIVAPVPPTVEGTRSASDSATSPLGDYSARLADFIRSQLNSIPTYRPADSISPISCPDFSYPSRSPLQSPAKGARRHVGAPCVIDIPSVRPPARSAFSAWSSTDDDTDGDALSLTDSEPPAKADTSTPSVLRYYEQDKDATFLFSSTLLEKDQRPDTAKAFSFPDGAEFQEPSAELRSPHQDDGYSSSVLSRPSLLTPSPAPSFSSMSMGSYFEYKKNSPYASDLKDRIIAAVTPPPGKVISAISPFEASALANVHKVLVQPQHRVLVDGMSFDMVRDLAMPEDSTRRVQTPC